MSSATSRADSGDINFAATPTTGPAWLPWAIAGAVILALAFILTKK